MTENESCTGEDLVLVGPPGKEFKAIEKSFLLTGIKVYVIIKY